MSLHTPALPDSSLASRGQPDRRRAYAVAGLIAAALIAARCSSSSSTATGPSPVKCQVSVSTAAVNLDPAGATGSVTVTTDPECTWTASTSATWIGNLSPVSGQGSGRVDFRVTANPAPTMRQGEVVVNGSNAIVRQEGSPCRFQISPSTHPIESGGGTASVAVSTEAGCTWSASASDGWVRIVSGESGSGNGAVTMQAAANEGDAERTSILTIAGQPFTLTQAARLGSTLCALQITPSRAVVGPSADEGPAISVETAASCAWAAATDTPWITITSASEQRGEGRVTYTVGANNGGLRHGAIRIGDQTVEIDQDGATSCSYAVSPASLGATAAGGPAGPIAVATTDGCPWSATSNAPWITVASTGARSGSGTVSISIAANTGASRSGSVTVAGRAVSVSQEGTPNTCTFSITPASQSVPASGGAGTPVNVATAGGCAWSTTSTVPWITLGSPSSGTGNGTVTFTVAANSGGSRTAALTIAGQTMTLTQAGAAIPPSCTFSVSPTRDSVPAGGGQGATINVSSPANCSWNASTDAPWITIVSGAVGGGNGSVVYSASPNTGAARSGTIVVADARVAVEQAAAPCEYTIAPTSQSVGAGGGAGSPVSVTTRNDCSWTAASGTPWLTITSGASGSGNGSVAFTVAANTGGARTGELLIAGRTFSVSQSAPAPPCTYSIAPGSGSVGAAGGAGGPVTVTTGAGCSWTATSGAPWLTITSGPGGSGGGTVSYTAAANTGAQRTGNLTIAGQTFTVTQAAAPPTCTYSIAPTAVTATAAGGAGAPVTVTTSAGCTWTSTSNASWITITGSGSGTGGGTVNYSVAANSGAQRVGSLTIAGQSFTVTQSQACSYTINPASQNIAASGGAGTSIAVTASTGCGWTATSNASWLTITSGATGSGNGSVGFTAAANTGAERTGTLTVAGQTFTVTQAAVPPQPCSGSINPTSRSISALGGSGSVSVSAMGNCNWTAVSNASWISVTSGASDRGNGSVSYSVAVNVLGQRSGTITIAGQSFTVNQAAVVP